MNSDIYGKKEKRGPFLRENAGNLFSGLGSSRGHKMFSGTEKRDLYARSDKTDTSAKKRSLFS